MMGKLLAFPLVALESPQRKELLDILTAKEELKRTKILVDLLSDQLKIGVEDKDLFVVHGTLKLSQSKLTSMGEELNYLACRYLNRYQ